MNKLNNTISGNPPLVSFIMSVYALNGPKEVRRSLESCVKQDYPNIEMVVVLDGKVPETLMETILDIKNNNPSVPFKIIQLEKNSGLGPALNEAIKNSSGDYLARMDTDDYSHPDRISAQMDYLLKHPEVDVLGCCMEEIFDTKNKGTIKTITSMPLTHEECKIEFIRRDPIHHPTALFRKRYFEKAGMYTDKYPLDEDSALWLEGMKHGCIFANLAEPKYTMFLTRSFFRRRKSYATISSVFKVRLKIIKEMGYSFKGYFWALFRVLVALLPYPMLKLAYMSRGRFAKLFKKKSAKTESGERTPAGRKVFYITSTSEINKLHLTENLPEQYIPAVFTFGIRNIFPEGLLKSTLPPKEVKILCLIWYLMELLSGFKRKRGFYIIYDSHSGRIIHYTGFSPGDYRFPFMNKNDIILGPSRTHAQYMRRGLQSYCISRIIKNAVLSKKKYIWYVTDESNIAPRKSVEKIGFILKGYGHRKARTFLRPVPQYRLLQPS